MKNTENKVVAFLRVANHKQVHEHNSLHHQLDQIEEYASPLKLEIAAVFENSDKTELEDDLGEMLWYCEENPDVNQVLVTSFDRISRNVDEIQEWKERFSDIGVSVKPVSQSIVDSPTIQFMDAIRVMSGQMHNEQRSHLVKDRMRQKAEAGYLMYAPPIGYERRGVNGVHRPNKFGLLLGMALSNIAMLGSPNEQKKLLFEVYEGHVGRKPTKIELRRWISNPYYVGLVKYEGKTYRGLHKALFSQEVQELLIKALS